MKIMILLMTISLLTPINQHAFAKDMPSKACTLSAREDQWGYTRS